MILDTNTIAALEKLRAADFLIPTVDAGLLIEAARLQHALTQVLRIASGRDTQYRKPRRQWAEDALVLTRAAEAGSFAQV